MTTPDKQGQGLRDQIESERGTLSERVAMLQDKAKALGLTETAGRLLVATEHQLVWLDWESGTIDPWIDLEPSSSGLRMNDGRTDPVGRFLVGSMWPDTKAGRRDGRLHDIFRFMSRERITR